MERPQSSMGTDLLSWELVMRQMAPKLKAYSALYSALMVQRSGYITFRMTSKAIYILQLDFN